MEQMMDWMLAKMDSFQEEMRTNQGKMEAGRSLPPGRFLVLISVRG
jgi:hypothetical protein